MSRPLSEFDYHEVLDRASTMQEMFATLIVDHPVATDDEEIKKQAIITFKAIAEFYQYVGAIRFDKFK